MNMDFKLFLLRTLLKVVYVLNQLLDFVSYPFYAIYYQPWRVATYKRKVHSREERKADRIIYEGIYDKPNKNYEEFVKSGYKTLYEAFEDVVDKYGERDVLGTREIFSEENELQPDGKVFKKYLLGDYSYISYNGLRRQTSDLADGLMDLGIEPRSRIAILSESRQEWVVSMYAAFKNNYTLVTLYTNLGNDAVEEGLNETEVPLVIVSDEVLPKFKGILEACPLIKYVVVIEAGNGKKSDLSVNYQNNFQFIMYRDLLKRRSKKKYNRSIPSTNDTAIIMYTSGSTGRPKGVMVNHGDAIAGLRSVISYTDFTTSDRYLAYLPLAHIMEIVAEMACLYCGVKIGYSSPLTLTDNGSKVKKGCKGDANVFKPTLMCAVPLLLQRIYKGIIDNMRKKGWAMEELFNYFVAYKIKWQDRGFDTPLLNKTLFRTVRYFLGGRVRLLLNGGAPISHETHLFTRTTLSVPVLQAYGLTELSGAAAISNEYDFSTCRVGPPLIGVKVKLVNWEEGGYTINDKPFPRGEIHCGGESLCQGYFKNPEKTADDFYEEDGIRWFKTGDIGQMEADGVLKLVDRKKDLVKLSGGEYISYGKVESILKTCPFIENICTYADPLKDYLFAIAIPDKAHVNQRGLTQEDACKDPSFISSVTKEIGDYGLKNGLVKFEVPAKILFVSGEWTTDNGLITAAFKTRRRPIVEYYRIQVDKIYC